MLSVDESLSDEDAVGIGRKGTIDKPQLLKAPFWTVDTLFFMTPKPNSELFFLYALSQGIEWSKLDESTGVPSLSKTNIENIVKQIPNHAEQIAIGNFFRTLDTIITANQQKLLKLKQLKAAYLQQMFPQAVERVPRVRFDGFAGAWEQRTIEECISEKISNGIMNRPGKNKMNARHINVVNLYAPSYIHVHTLEYFNATSKDIEKCNIEIGDIFLTRSSLKVDGIAQANILLDDGNYVFDDHIMRLKMSNEFDAFFVKEALNYFQAKKEFMSKSKTGTMTTIGQDDITSSNILFPQKGEQSLIGCFFLNFDKLIAVQVQKVEQLKNMKSAYLQKMFI